ncbi:LPXTG-motif cell wall anchor domain-containing protein [Mesobacillus persicus]|uniref:LPXTG-motif cell wall anchor domain-containing protein n=1 Tax=Mesobacillus persicus TaxID=930146 RepID=A0A1H8G9A4_9BACI|nr:5'-nucleotidase C-terminal domain-containing protein [Mesobacillus persicus]SEN40419.1 LPXTG-motif cell wall anchor domain-containing protein [Mesobacillus persicus]
MKIFKKQWFILTIIFTMLVGYAAPVAQVASAEDGFITVEEAIANNSGVAIVKGYIVGTTISKTNFDLEAPFTTNTNIAIADNPNETDISKLLPVQLPTGAVRNGLNLMDNQDLLGKVVYLTGSLEAYFTIPGLKNVSEYSFDGVPEKPPIEGLEGLKINQIQGEGHNSIYDRENVIGIEGIVTYVDDASNFYIQDPEPDNNPKTSEGILVYKKNHGVSVGDHVSVDGLVKEWIIAGYDDKLKTDLATTEIDANNGTVTVLDSNQVVPEPLVIGKDIFPPTQVVDNDQFSAFDPEEDAIDFYESIEGMLVAVENPIAVGPQKYGEIPVITQKDEKKTYTIAGGLPLQANNTNPERLHLLYDDRNYVVKTGDSFNGTVTGVVSYTFQNFKILTKELPKKVEGDFQPTATELVKDDSKLTVANYNMENFVGTETEKKNKIAKSIVEKLNSPDIIGLVEVQDNNGTGTGVTAADQNYEALIAAIKAHGGPTYAWTDIAPEENKDGGAPNGNIRVGFIYNIDRVSLAEGNKGSATEAVGYENGSLTLNPGRIDPTNTAFNSSRKPLAAQFEFNGEDVIVINNHFNSKGGDQPIFGKNQPPVLGSEAQRVKIAGIVNNFVKEVQNENADANVVVMGDLNDFEFSNPIQTLKGSELTNLIESVPAAERFTYNYQGNSQVLDHILVTNNLAAGAEVDVVHINSSFMEAHGRASDHDPVIAQLDLGTNVENNFNLTVLHTNDTHGSLDNMPKTVTAVKEERVKDPNALLLHAGDAFSGTLYFNEFQGKADLDLMNLMGFDAMTFGNHEFDLGSSADGHAKLVEFIQGAQFPFVSSNVNFSQDDKFNGLFNNLVTNDAQNGQIYDAIIKEVNGEKVGIFGLTTEETADISSPGSVAFENYLEEAEKAVEALEAQGVNKIIALTHIGYDDNAAIDNDLTLAKEVEGIDIIVGGHSHTALTEPTIVAEDATPTVIVQTGSGNSNLGLLNVEFDETGVVVAQAGKLIKIDSQTADQEAVEILAPYKTKVAEIEQQEIGVVAEVALENPRTNGDNTKSSVRRNETILGNLITDGMLAKAKSFTGKDVIMALQNGGGIRSAIDAGPITVGEVIKVLPFGNTLATMELTGAELKEAFEISVSQYPGENGGFLHVAGGKVEFDARKPAGERVESVKYLDQNGAYVEVQDDVTYTVATNAFTAKGGDGYGVFAKAYEEGRVTDLGLSDWENFRDHLVSLETIPTSIEGRIVLANFDLTVLHTNDTHGSLDNMPKTVTAVKDERAKDPNALLLHAGDAFSGTLYFNEFKGKADLDLMNLMGFDAMTFGNHEFDLGSSSEGHGKLVEFIQGAQFPFVSSNVDFSQDDKFNGLFNDLVTNEAQNGQIYDAIIKEVNGEKVGIFGLTTEETASISSPGSIAFENYLLEAEKAVEALEAQGVNKIIALTHIGYDDNAAIDNDLTLAKEVEGIDIIVGGHSHTALTEPTVVAVDATPTVIVQTGSGNSNLGFLNVEFDEIGVVVANSGKLIKIGSQIADQDAVEILAPYKTKVVEIEQQEIGVVAEVALENPRTNGDNTQSSVRRNETILGNLITDGMLAKAKSFTDKDVIMALQNGGGIRSAIDAGPITVGEVIKVLPFGNTLATMELTGAELKRAFEISVSQYPGENGGFLHVAGGKVEFDSTKPAGERVVSVKYLVQNGAYVEVQDNVTYTVATNAFTAKGGDGYDVFAKAYEEGRVTDLGLSDWENFRDHLVSLTTIPTQVEGRIVDVSKEPGDNPGEEPGENPGEDPGENPGEEPGENPGTNPGQNPGTNPGANPGQNPGTNPGANPGQSPDANPGKNPSVIVKPKTTVNATNKTMTVNVVLTDVKKAKANEVVIIQPKNAKEQVELKVELDKAALNSLIEKNNELKIEKGDSSLIIPVSILEQIAAIAGDQPVVIKMVKQQAANALGAVYDFTITAGSTVISDFNGQEVTFTLEVNPDLVADLDPSLVKAFYYNEETKEWEVIEDSVYDPATGLVTATTTHFSTYGVFKDDSSETKGTPSVASTGTNGNILPNTATNQFNLLALGLLLVAMGAVVIVSRRRTNMNS